MNYKIAQLMLSSSQKGKTAGDVFVAQEDRHKEDLAGKLFALLEIGSAKSTDYRVIDFIINNLNHNYYQNEKILLRERVSTLQVEHIFESALIKTSKALIEFIKDEKINLDPKTINATLGIVYENQIHFTSLGKNRTILIHKKKDDQYHLTDITEKTKDKEDEQEPTLAKLFPNIVSGSIPTDGYFLITNEALPEYISSRQMIDIITTLPPLGAVEQIKNDLITINDYISFIAIIIKNNQTPDRIAIKDVSKTNSSNSIHSLNTTEQATENLLSPSGIVNLKKYLNIEPLLAKINFPWNNSANNTGNKLFLTQGKISFSRRSYLKKIKQAGKIAQDALIYLLNLIVFLFKKIWHFREFIISIKNLVSNSLFKIKNFISWFSNLKRNQKIAIGVTFLSAVFLLFNLYFQNKKNQQAELAKAYTDISQQIEKKQNEVDASLLYNDENRAKSLFNDINQLITQLPSNNNDQKTAIEKFKTKYAEQMKKVSKMETINDPVIATDWSADEAIISEIALTEKGKLFAIDNNHKVIRDFSIADKKTKVSPIQSETNLLYPSLGNNDEVYFVNSSTLVMWDDTKLNTLNPSPAFSTLEIIDMYGFNNRLYAIDKKTNQIYKYDKLSKGGTGTIWLKDPADLSNARGLSIDGKLYILTPDNVLAFANGKKEELNLEKISPALEDATKIQTTVNAPRIYILEPKNKRIVVFDKTGKLLAQYTSEKFNDLKDIAIDEVGKKLYVLNGAVIYSIDMATIK